MSSDKFYRDFEAAFRGDRQEITARLEVYLDFALPLLEVSTDRRVIDLGCGRGEWLELIGRSGFQAHGVDLDQGMLEDCYRLGLSAELGDAIEHLRQLPDNSQAIVSGFHIAEHLPFEVLQTLIQDALRVLEPGGLLILETPNAENLRVGTLSFHMDPTHNKPLPPGLLSFLPRHYGFSRSIVVRLQESPALRAASHASLFDVFAGVSPDFAVVAQKAADPSVLVRFDMAFERDRGLTLETLAGRFEAQLARQADFAALKEAFEQHAETLSAEVEQLRSRTDAVYSSTSWRITAPMRQLVDLLRAQKTGARAVVARGRVAIRGVGYAAIGALSKRPALRQTIIGGMRKVPGLEAQLRRLLSETPGADSTVRRPSIAAQLTPRAAVIHEKIQKMRGRR